MPTENRSSTIEQHDHIEGIIDMVSVPREWLNSVALLQMPLDELQEQAIQHLCEPCDEPAPQPHPEPIAWMVGTAFWWTKEEAERDAAATGLPIVGLGPMSGVTPEQHRGEPVGVEGATFMGEPNFQHSVEWYRQGISKHWKKICEQRVSIDALQKQLAEVQALLRIYESFPGYLIDHCEGDTIYEESLQHWLAAHIKSLPAHAEQAAPNGCAICRDLGNQCMECEEVEFREWADRHFAAADYRKTDSGVFIQDWMRHAYGAWCARGALAIKQ